VSVYVIIFFLVSVFWVFFFDKIFSSSSNTKKLSIWLAFWGGVLSGPIAGTISYTIQKNFLESGGLSDYVSDFLLYFFIVGPIEEFSKFLIAIIVTLKTQMIQRYVDGMLLAVIVAIGFAAGENILYLIKFGPELTWLRLILGNLGHAAYAIFWGYAIGVVFTQAAPGSLLVIGLLLSSFLHGAYDYFLTFNLTGLIIALTFSLVMFVFLFWFIRFENKQLKKK